MSSPMDGEARMGGSVWCATHERWECTRRSKRSLQRCHGIALRGIDRCRAHAGERPDVARARGEALSAWTALAVLDGGTTVDPGTAMLGMLHMSWLRVHLYAGLLEAQVGREGLAQERGAGVDGGSGSSGLIGHTYGAVKDIGVYASGEAVRGLALLEAQERDRCARFAKAAHDMGIADRQIRLAESQGALLAGVIRGVLADLDLSVEQQARVAEVVPRHLRQIAELEAGGAA